MKGAPSLCFVAAIAIAFPAMAGPQVGITRYPAGISQPVGQQAETDSFVVANAGPGAASIQLVPTRNFFDVSPANFTLDAGASTTIAIHPIAQQAGFYEGAVNVFVAGAAAPLIVPVRLFIGTQPQGVVAPQTTDLLTVSGLSGQPHPSGLNVRNAGNVTMEGMLVPDVAWIAPQTGIAAIQPNGNVVMPFIADPSQRPDSIFPLGAVLGEVSLLYLKGTAPGVEQSATTSAQVYDFSKVSVVPAEPSPAASGETIAFLPNVTDLVGFTDVFLSNRSRSTLSTDLKLFYTSIGAPASTSLLANVGRLPSSIAAWFPAAPWSIFNVTGQNGTIQVRTSEVSKVSIAGLHGVVPDGTNRYLTAMPVLTSERSVANNDRLLFAGVEKATGTHTDIFLQEAAGFSATYTIDFFDLAGNPLAPSRSGSLLPFGFVTLADTVPAGARSARITNTSNTNARVTAFAAVVDESTLDAWIIVDASRTPAPSTDLVIPVPALTGAPSTSTFDVWVTNGGDSAASVTIGSTVTPAKRRAVRRNTGAANTTDVIQFAPHETKQLTKTNAQRGVVTISGPTGAIGASGRLTSTVTGRRGSFGTGVPATPAARAAGVGVVKRFARANDVLNFAPPTLLLLEVAGQPATVRVTIDFNFPAGASVSGQVEASKDYALAANDRLTIPDLVRAIFGPGRDSLGVLWNVVVNVEVISGDGRVLPYLQTIDASGDLTFSVD